MCHESCCLDIQLLGTVPPSGIFNFCLLCFGSMFTFSTYDLLIDALKWHSILKRSSHNGFYNLYWNIYIFFLASEFLFSNGWFLSVLSRILIWNFNTSLCFSLVALFLFQMPDDGFFIQAKCPNIHAVLWTPILLHPHD